MAVPIVWKKQLSAFKLRKQNAIESIISINLVRPLSVSLSCELFVFSLWLCKTKNHVCNARTLLKRLFFWTIIYFSFLALPMDAHFEYVCAIELAPKQFIPFFFRLKHGNIYTETMEVVCFNNKNWFHVGFYWCFWSRTVFFSWSTHKNSSRERENKIQTVKYIFGCITWQLFESKFK